MERDDFFLQRFQRCCRLGAGVPRGAEQLFRYSVLQAAAATEGPGIAWAASPYPDGTWEKGVREEFAKAAAYMKDVRQSLTKVYPSTSFPTPEGSQIAKLPHGIVATKATSDAVEYLHVLNPPEGKSLLLPPPKDGRRFTSARLLKNGRKVELAQSSDGLRLVLGDKDDWDRLDTVIALEVDRRTLPRLNLALHRKVIASSSVESGPRRGLKSDYGRIRVNDGQKHVLEKPQTWSTANSGWSSERTKENTSQWVGVDLDGVHRVSEVRLYPRDDPGKEGTGFPADISIEISLDGETWTAVAARSDLPRTKAALVVKFPPARARYVRAVGTDLRQNPGDGLYSMQIVELEVF